MCKFIILKGETNKQSERRKNGLKQPVCSRLDAQNAKIFAKFRYVQHWRTKCKLVDILKTFLL